jgi:polysaccharide biosynthesis protein PslG
MLMTRLFSAVRVLVCTAVCATFLSAQVPRPTPSVERPYAGFAADSNGYFQMQTAIGDDYFDGRDTVERIRRHLKIARSAGVHYLRCGFSWNGIEPERGDYRFDFWDKLVEEASRANIELVPYVAYTPEWAARSKEEFWKQPPSVPADYATLMRKLAERYRGRIRHWELWNEPDNKEYWNGSPDDFATTIILAAQAVREVAPETVLVLGGMSQGPGSFFDVLVSRYHVEQYVDVLALHAYPESWHEERAETVFGDWIDKMDTVSRPSGRALWLNEMGYADYRYRPPHASVWGTNAYYRYEHTQRYAADFLFKSFAMTLASGDVSLAGWYRIDDFREDDPRMPSDKVHDHLGITAVNGKEKPTFQALRFFNLLFSKPIRLADTSANSGRSQSVVHVFQRNDAKVVVTGWIRSSNYSEVPVHSGMQPDQRLERVDVELPCTAETLETFNAVGKRLSVSHPRRRKLPNIQLRGDRVFIAEVTCSAGN